MQDLLDKEELLLSNLTTKRKIVDDEIHNQYNKVQKVKQKMKNPVLIILRPFLQNDDFSLIVQQYLDINYCLHHMSIFPGKECIGCFYPYIKICNANQDSWLWFHLHKLEMNTDGNIIGFHKTKDYYIQQHLLKIIAKPELFWMGPNPNVPLRKYNLGIFYSKGEYKIIISDLANDDEEDLQDALHGDLSDVPIWANTPNFELIAG